MLELSELPCSRCVEILIFSDVFKKYSQGQESSMGDREKKLLSILDEIIVKRQAYHGNLFVGYHYKVVLAKDKNQAFNFVKLCSVLTDEVTKYHFEELLRIYSGARSVMARRQLLLKIEKVTLKSLCYNFGALLPVYFPISTLTHKIHELVFHAPRFIDDHGTVGFFSEEKEESLNHLINLEAAQLFCFRNDSKRL